MGSSWTRDQTRVPCIGRQVLNYWTTKILTLKLVSHCYFHRKAGGKKETETGLVSYFMMFIMRALPVLTIVCSSPAFATPPWRAESLGQENGVWENWVVYTFQQGRKHTFFILLLQTRVPHRWWEREVNTWRPGRQGVWAGASFSCCSKGNSAWCSELVQMGPREALLLSRGMASGMWIL